MFDLFLENRENIWNYSKMIIIIRLLENKLLEIKLKIKLLKCSHRSLESKLVGLDY